MTPDSRQIVVARPRDLIELEAIKSELQSHDIPFVVQGEHYFGVSGARAAIGDAVMRVSVPQEYAETAKKLIAGQRNG